MKFKKEKGMNTKTTPKKKNSSILMYAGAVIVALVGVATLVNNVILFNTSVTSYVAQGYKRADVLKQMIPGQLLPSIFEAVAMYGGIALVLLCAGIINNKLSKSLTLLENEKWVQSMESEQISEMESVQSVESNDTIELVEA